MKAATASAQYRHDNYTLLKKNKNGCSATNKEMGQHQNAVFFLRMQLSLLILFFFHWHLEFLAISPNQKRQ